MRAFIALELPAALQPPLRALQHELAAALEPLQLAHFVQWTAVANIHLTLRFLGETTPAQHAAVAAALRTKAAHMGAFDLLLRDIGCFPNFRRPTIIWLGLEAATPGGQPAALQAAAEEIAIAAGFAPETRTFTPHLTLARLARSASPGDSARVGETLQRVAQTPAVRAWQRPVHVDHVTLMQSDLRPQGPLYTPLARVALAQAAALHG